MCPTWGRASQPLVSYEDDTTTNDKLKMTLQTVWLNLTSLSTSPCLCTECSACASLVPRPNAVICHLRTRLCVHDLENGVLCSCSVLCITLCCVSPWGCVSPWCCVSPWGCVLCHFLCVDLTFVLLAIYYITHKWFCSACYNCSGTFITLSLSYCQSNESLRIHWCVS